MRKIYRLGIMMLLMLAAALPAARAYNFVSGGIYYDITGSSPNTVAVTYATGSYNSYSGEVSIPSTVTYNGTHYTVTAIGNNAFRNCSNLTGVTIPGTVTSIGEYAFYGCSGLISVTIPNGVETIGASAFQSCSGLTSLSFGNTVTSIGDYAFQSCSGLTTVAIPISVTTIGTSSFQYCNSLSSLIIGESVVSVGNYAFQSCGNLTSVVIPHSVKTIGGYAFQYCNSLSSVMFNADSCEVMGNSTEMVFANCNHLTQLTIGNNVKSIPEYAFKGCDSLTTFFIPGAVSYIASNAFINCNHIATISVSAQNTTYDSRNNCNAIIHTSTNTLIYGCNNSTIPNSVRAIGEYAFYGREGLSGAFIIPDSVSVIGSSAFYGCSGLTSLTIGRNIDSIGVLSFGYCTGLNTINFNADSCKFMGYTYLGYLNYQTAFTGCNNISSLFIGNNVKVIPDLAFYGLNHISGMLFLPDSLIYIGSRAFNHCSSITGTLTIPQKVTFIGAQAFQDCSGISALVYNADSCTFGGEYYDPVFSGCNNLVSLSIGNNVRIIPDLAFSGCSNLTGSLTIPNTVKSIGFCAFRNCSGLIGTLSLPLSVTRIGDCAFYNCSGLTGELVIHDSVSYIGYWSFYNCTGLTSLTIGKTVDTINHSAFYACTGLVSVVFNADSCTYMGWRATCTLTQNTTYCPVFQDCANLTTLSIGENVKIIPSYAFAGCSALSAVTIPRSVRQIGDAAFYGCENLSSVAFNADSCGGTDLFSNCTNLTSITIGEYVKNIPDGVFSGCTGLTGTLIFPSSLKNIGRNAFLGCNGLTGTLVIPDSVTSIGCNAFDGCSGFDTLVIGRAVTYIGSGSYSYLHSAFYNCTGLTTVFFNADSCTGVWHPNYPVFSTCTNITSIIIGDNVKVIPAYSFMNSSALSFIVVGRGVREIKEKAFYNCSNLAAIFFNADSCTFIDNTGLLEHQRAFGYCNNLSSVVFGNNVKIIPEHAFHYCSSLTGTLVIPDSVVSIGTSAFQGCSGIDSLVMGENVLTIGGSAFYSCSGLESITIGEHVDSIGSYAFGQCSNLRFVEFNARKCHYASHAFGECDSLSKVVFGSEVEYIPAYSFSECNGLKDTLCIPNSVVSIGNQAFYDCTTLSTVVFGNSLKTIGSSAFYNCSGLTGTLKIPDSVTTINPSTFSGCSGLNGVVLGNSLTYIKAYAFKNCSGLTGVLYIPDSVRIIDNSAFSGCSGLSSLILGRSVDSLGTQTFANCTGLSSIVSYATTAPYTAQTSSDYYNNGTFKNVSRSVPLYIPCGSISSYQNNWRYYGSYAGYSPYFYNISEISSHRLSALSSDTLQGTVQVTTLPTCTGPAVVEATPKFFYVFDHWSDGSTDNPRTIELTQDTTLVAHFREYALNIIQPSDSTYGQVIVLQQPTADNPQAVVEMIADTSCYNFYSWITPANDWESIGNENPITITLTQDTTIRATVISSLHMEVTQQPQWYDHVCEGDTMTVTASGANAYLWTTYHWDGSEGRYVDDDTLGFNADLHLTEVGSYRLRVTGTDSSGCKGWYNIQQVHVFPNPDFTINGATDICEGESTTLSVSLGQYESELFEDFSNGLPNNWSVNYTNLLSYYELENSSHGRAVLFPCYQLNSGMSVDLRLPSLNFNNSEPSTLSFDVAYRSYSGEADQLRVLYSIDNGNSWNVLYSKSGSNLATLSPDHQEFFPTDDKWRKDSVNLSMLSGMYDVLVKFEFTSRYGNNLWIDNVQIDNVLVSSTNPYSHDYLYYYYFWSNGATGSGIYQQTVDSNGVYSVTVSSGLCSSTDSVTVTVWQPDTTELTVTAEHSPYTLNGETFCTSGDYTQTLQNIHGCDSVVTLHLTVPTDTTFVYDTVCAGTKSIQQMNISPEEYQQMQWEYQFGDTLPFELSYDTITNTLTVKYVQISFYEQWETGYNEYGNPTYNYFDTTLYLNYNVWKDSAYYDNFSYTITYPSSTGCDSTVTWHRKILFSDNAEYIITACGYHIWQGDSLFGSNGATGDYQIFHAGDTLTQSGEYAQIYQCQNGCDSVIHLHFNFIPALSEDISATACDSYTWNDITYTESGDYTLNSDTTLAIVRNLYANYWGEWGYDDADGNFIYLRPSGWSQLQVQEDYDSETGDYTYYYYYTDQYGVEHLYNFGDFVPYAETISACKVTTLHLTITPTVAELVEATACDSYTWNDSVYTQSSDYTQTFTAANGCDSIVTLHLTVYHIETTEITETVCDSHTWNGTTYTASGDYVQTFETANGCDSLVTLHLTILPSPTPAITGVTTVCEGQTATLTATGGMSYLWEDGTATASFSTTESGAYTVTVTNANGCSATASATVTVNPLPEVAVTGNTYICPGGSTVLTATGAATYMWSNGSTNAAIPVNAFGQYSVIGTSAEGCFSTASVTVLVSQPPVITISGNTSLCTGESTTLTATGGVSYMWSNGSTDSAITVNTAGNWQVIGYNENNCSNMASVTVNVWQPAATDLYITSFDSCYMWFGTPRCESGDYTHTLQTIHGCDSVITLHLTLEDAIVTEFSATACDSYTWNGATYSQSGNYTQSFTAVNGNDSIVTLHLTVNNPVHTAVTAESCGSYEWNGQTYTVSGDYTHEHLDANGCTQVDTLHLTIFNPVHTAVTAGSCGPYEWNGQTYTVSGDYTHEHLDANGCTQVDTLHLTIFNPVHTAVTAESCGSYEWNGQTYTVSGDYTHEHLDANGCTQVDTLHLTVNDTLHIEFADSTCTAYVWNGQTYTASGDYTQTFAAANGCDSVVTLHLTIVPAITPVISVTGSLAACGDGSATLTVPGLYNSFAWSTGSTDPAITVSEAGFYWVTATDVYGCEGVSEMVQVGSSVQIEETPAICMVGVEDQHNLVVWEPLADTDVAEYRLYRENGQANIFEPLAVIPAGSGNAYADTTADPSVRAWRYKITAADTCGGETPMSALHKTVHLTINQGLGNSYNLIWTPYEGFEFASYRLYRGTANNNLQLIQTMPSTLTSFTDQNPAGDALFYQIEVVMDGNCVQETRDITFSGARSNIVYNGVPVATDVAVEACESYDWNGEVLTSSGEYTRSFNSVLGYDSVVTLHLTIHQPATSEFTVSCPDSCYTWNGTEYCASGDYTQTLQTVHGCDSVVTLHLTITVGIDDHDLAGSVKVFPNPANSMLNVQWAMGNEAATIELLDVTGKLLRTISATGETTSINVSDLADGMYFVRVTTEDGMVTKPFVVKR